MYYLRTRPAADPIKFSVDKTILRVLTDSTTKTNEPQNNDSIDQTVEAIEELRIMEEIQKRNVDAIACSLTNPEGCLSCQG